MTRRSVLAAGGGFGGLAAAVTALHAGAAVTVVEKCGRLGGSMTMSIGMLTTFEDLNRFRPVHPVYGERSGPGPGSGSGVMPAPPAQAG